MNQNLAKKAEHLDARIKLFKEGGSDVFANAYEFTAAEMARQMNIFPCYQTLECNQGPVAIMQGKEVVMLGSNNYLGLTIHPEVRQAAIDAVRDYGTSMTGSRLANGTHKLHEELEEKLAAFLGKESCLVFTTGYQANLGLLSALVSKGNYVIIDKGDHASIYDGASMCKGDVVGFKHNDVEDLEKVLSGLDPQKGKLVMVDGVFSMEGDIAPLPKIREVCDRYAARLVVDDAHAVGILGDNGQGTGFHFGMQDQVDLVAGTFSKTLASIGGFVAGDFKVIDFIKIYGRSIVFSASLPPASTAAALKALEIMQREPERVARVNANGHYMRENLKALGFDIGLSETPIVPIVIGDEMLTLLVWRELLDAGIYVNAVLYPAVPKDKALLRTSVTSEHTREHLDKALEIIAGLKKKHSF